MQEAKVLKSKEAKRVLDDLTKRGKRYFFIVDFTGEEFLIYDLDLLLEEGENAPVWFDFEGFTNVGEKQTNHPEIRRFIAYPYGKYEVAFQKVMQHINYGDTYLLNLTFRSQLFFDDKTSLKDIFACSQARFKVLLKDKFVSFSPEPFVFIEPDGIIFTFPMKGTANASVPGAKEQLEKNEKEISEHYTIVDLLRNDLALVARGVEVDKFRYFELIKTVRGDLWQTSSKISGKLLPEYRNSYGSVLAKMLPAGSVSGAPKQRTVKIIRKVEENTRGFYTGVAGYFDGKKFVSAVLIRFIEKNGKKFYYRSGGGIVSASNCKAEYDELVKKIYLPCER